MRVAVDGWVLREPLTGVGRYAVEVMKAARRLDPSVTFYVLSQNPREPVGDGIYTIVDDGPLWYLWAGTKPLLWTRYRSGRMLDAVGADVCWGAATFLPKHLHIPAVSTVFDLCYKVCPETMTWGFLQCNRLWFLKDVKRSKVAVCISHGTAKRLIDATGPRKVVVAHPGTIAYGDKDYGKTFMPYVLAVGTHEPRKNLGLVVEAFARCRFPRRTRLVVAGAKGWKFNLDRAIVDVGLVPGKDVVVTGHLSQQMLYGLYTNAKVLVFPSKYEGYGMPIAEALACGCPVVTTDTPETREAGREGAIFVDPTVNGVVDGIAKAYRQPRPRAHMATWNAAAEVHLLAWREAWKG